MTESVPSDDSSSSNRSSIKPSLDELEKMWQASPERDLAEKARTAWIRRAAAVALTGTIAVALYTLLIAPSPIASGTSPLATSAAIILVSAVAIWRDYSRKRWKFEDAREDFFRASGAFVRSQRIRDVSSEDESDKLSLGNLFELNQFAVDEYHDITREQSTKAFKNSQFASAVGLLLLAIGIGLAFVPAPLEARIASVSVASLGSILSGYISKTFLESHKISVRQLNEFFKQPVVGNYLLIAERLSGQLQPSARDEAIIMIIKQAVKAADEISRQEDAAGQRQVAGPSDENSPSTSSQGRADGP